MIPLILIAGEGELTNSPLLQEVGFWVSMTVSGILGFLINIAVYLQIKHTSPLTNNISGTLKACVQTLLAMMIYQNPITFLVQSIYICCH
jgi:GDP-fucose transporter C1